MSDEYSSSGYRGSLVNQSASDPANRGDDAYSTRNYPPSNDSTSSGGYGSATDSYSSPAQRGRLDLAIGDKGPNLIDQSVSGGPLRNEIQDAKQGQDESSRDEFAHEARRDFGREANPRAGGEALNPYGRNPDNKEEAENMLASRHSDARGRQYESGGAASLEADSGTV
ncbi:hypothetical protein K474DRAFT_1623706 [Panus rudis PR-1116 ss-1]|nr:hypothetical protein K474DRAFT_1623706 [Panus rudis PR-1116 ss-1]